MELERLKTTFNWDIASKAAWVGGYWKVEGKNGDTVEYPEEGNDTCFELEEKSFWFKHRSLIIGDFWKRFSKSKSFWEVGAGNGYVASCLKKLGASCVTVEPGPRGAEHSAGRGNESICAFLKDLTLPDNSIPTIGCFDVLEHLDHPEELVKEFYRILEFGGKVIVTVPAHMYLWSQTDDMSIHKRRYGRQELIQLLSNAGFKLERSSYFFTSMVFPMYFLRARPYRNSKIFDPETLAADQKSQMLGSSLKLANALIEAVLHFERFLLKYFNLPTGTSLIGVFSK